MARRLLASRVAIAAWVTVLGACSHGASAPDDAAAPAASSSATASAAITAPALPEARCVDDGHAEVRRPDGSIAQIACGADSVCLGGACAPLSLPAALGEGKVDPARLLRFTGAGWIGAWTQLGPFDRAQVDALAKSPRSALDDTKKVRALCSADGRLDVKPRGGGHAVLAGLLVSARPQRVWIKAGVAGKLRVWIAGEKAEKVFEASRTQGLGPLPDEIVEPAQLAAGPNLVLVDVGGSEDGPPSLWIRVRDDRQQNPADVAFAPASPKAECAVSSLIALAARRTVTDDGLDLELSASLPGLAPRAPEPVPYRVELAAKKAVAVTEGQLSPADLETETGAKIAAHVAPASGKKQEVRVTLGGGEAARRSFPVHFRKKLFPRVAALVKALGSIPASAPAGSRDSFTRDVEDIARATSEGHPDEAWITRRLDGAEALAEAFARGEDPYRKKTGVVFRAYR